MNDDTKKPRKTRRVPVNSHAGIAQAILSGGKKIVVPKHLDFTAVERCIFTELAEEMSKAEISPHKVTMLVLLTRQMAMLQNEQALIKREGAVLTNSHGNAVANPRVKICAGLTANILSMRRSLGIHARELAGGDNRRTAIMRDHNKRNEAILDDLDDDGLIPRNVVPIRAMEETEDDS